MNTEIEQVDFISTELQKFNITDTVISEWSDKFLKLNINGVEDKSGYESVREGRLFIKGRRVEVEKTSKLLKADALAFQRAVNEEEKRIVALLDPIENHLESQEKQFDAEKQRIKEEKERAEQARINGRIAKLLQNGCSFNGDSYSIGDVLLFPSEIKTSTDNQFDDMLKSVIDENQKEIDAKAEIERLKAEEADRLKKEREELEAMRIEQAKQAAELKEQQDAINAQQAKIEKENADLQTAIKAEAEEKQRAFELEKAKEASAKQAKADLIEKQKIEAERKAEADRKAKLRADRLEALKPVKQKLSDFAALIDGIEIPVLNDSEADLILSSAKELLSKCSSYILDKSSNL